MELYYSKRHILETDTFYQVDWNVHSKAMLSIPSNQRHWITKHTFGFCGVNRTLMQWGQRHSANCARCDAEETTTHVWRCPHKDTQGRWQLFLSDLEIWLVAQHTCPDLTECLLRKLSSWSGNHTNVDPNLQQRCKAELAQDIIGWDFLLEGMLSQSWSEAQTLHFQRIGQRRTGVRWMTQLLLKFWGVCWDLWNIRNEWEQHKTQQQENDEAIRYKVHEAIHRGFSDLPRLQQLYTHQRLKDLKTSSIAFLKAWLLNLDASRRRAECRGVPSAELLGMQSIMRKFLGRDTIS